MYFRGCLSGFYLAEIFQKKTSQQCFTGETALAPEPLWICSFWATCSTQALCYNLLSNLGGSPLFATGLTSTLLAQVARCSFRNWSVQRLARELKDDSSNTTSLNTFPYKHTPAESLNRPQIHMHACLESSGIEGNVSKVPPGTSWGEDQLTVKSKTGMKWRSHLLSYICNSGYIIQR